MDQLAILGMHKTTRNPQEKAELIKFGRIVFRLSHISECEEVTDHCNSRYQCRLARNQLDHMENCLDEAGCDSPTCQIWKLVKRHMDCCIGVTCDLCAWKESEYPPEIDETYEEEEHVQTEENQLAVDEEEPTTLCCKIL